MVKVNYLLIGSMFIILLGALFLGCSTATNDATATTTITTSSSVTTSTTTTTTTSSTSSTSTSTTSTTTTTYAVPAGSTIAGMISDLSFGTLKVGLFNTASLSGAGNPTTNTASYGRTYNIATGETTQVFSIPTPLVNGTYYIGAVLFIGSWNSNGPGRPGSGDKYGSYSSGLWFPTSASPITYEGSTVTGIDFSLDGSF
ncbi:MAG: hypothetical protein ABH823_03020 [bacterium]